MKKLRAKNRTDVAIKGAEILSASARAETRDVSLSKGARASDRRSTTI
jgi:hypothetical protein